MKQWRRFLLACAAAALLAAPTAALADSTPGTILPQTTTHVVTVQEPIHAPSALTSKQYGSWLYTTSVRRTLLPDRFYLGRSDPWQRDGYGTMYDLNVGYSPAFFNGAVTNVDLTANRVLVKMTPDTYWSYWVDRDVRDHPVTQFSSQDPVAGFPTNTLEIKTGTTVTFWADTGHYVLAERTGPVAMDGEAPIDTSRTWSHTFNTPGVYRFVNSCGGGPTGERMPGLFIEVTGPQLYSYEMTSTTVASYIVEHVATTAPAPASTVQVAPAKPQPTIVKPKVRNKEIK